MSGWTKLFSSIVTSSIWCENDATLRVWIAMLAVSDADGVVDGTIPGFANLARVSIQQMRAAIDTLSAPDADSRTPDHEGRRIEVVCGGWRIINYSAYRERGQQKDGSRAPYYREYRRRRTQQAQQPSVARNTEVEVEAEAEAEVERSSAAASPPLFPPQAREPNDNGNYRVIERLASSLLDDQDFDTEGDLIDAVKGRCAELRIDYGRHPDVAHDVVHRACASAQMRKRLGLTRETDAGDRRSA